MARSYVVKSILLGLIILCTAPALLILLALIVVNIPFTIIFLVSLISVIIVSRRRRR